MKEIYWILGIVAGLVLGFYLGMAYNIVDSEMYITPNITITECPDISVETFCPACKVIETEIVIEETENSKTTFNNETNKTTKCTWLHPNKKICHRI